MPIKRVLSQADDFSIKKPIKIWTDDIDETSLEQLRMLGSLPFVFKHVAVMPDVHAGRGSTIGSVIATKGAITPATVGVDLGCGMSAYKLPGVRPEQLEGKLARIRAAIENVVPVGFAVHKNEAGLTVLNSIEKSQLRIGKAAVLERARSKGNPDKILRGVEKAGDQVGSLGGGNHFIEVCISKNNEVWLMLHSGSRGVGNLIAQHHISVAQGLMKQAFYEVPHRDLAYLLEGTTEFEHYIEDMNWAQDFAYLNRRAMGRLVLRELIEILDIRDQKQQVLRAESIPFIDCHHNYVEMERHFNEDVWVTRKGAVRARIGDFGIIPGSMGAKSFIVRGLGNPESFYSCSHGAGRRMSRTEAKKRFSADDLAKETHGIECRKDKDVVDEIPSAYKNIDEVMKNQEDLVEVVEELRQVVCVKG